MDWRGVFLGEFKAGARPVEVGGLCRAGVLVETFNESASLAHGHKFLLQLWEGFRHFLRIVDTAVVDINLKG